MQKQNEELKKDVDEKNTKLSELNTILSDVQDENVSLKKKHAANIKDLTRQLQSLQKKQLQIPNTPTINNSIPENSVQMTSQNSSSSMHKISRPGLRTSRSSVFQAPRSSAS